MSMRLWRLLKKGAFALELQHPTPRGLIPASWQVMLLEPAQAVLAFPSRKQAGEGMLLGSLRIVALTCKPKAGPRPASMCEL